MRDIEKYFNAEKYESVLFVLFGVVAITFATYCFLKIKQPFYYGMAYPLITVALIQIIVGSSVYFKPLSRTSTSVIPIEAVECNISFYRSARI
jgi:hypothetical protein